MNKLLATVAMIGSMSFAASASADEYATITHVNPNYQNVQCSYVTVQTAE